MYSRDDALVRLEELTDNELLVVLSTLLEEDTEDMKNDYPTRTYRFEMIVYLLSMDCYDDAEIDLQNERIDMIMEEDWSDEL